MDFNLYHEHFLQSENFPMTVEMLLNILEVVTPFKHLKKLREFVTMKLPPGFPVKIGMCSKVISELGTNILTILWPNLHCFIFSEIPILPTITAKITFQEFAFRDDLQEEFFRIPSDYVESTNRFPEL